MEIKKRFWTIPQIHLASRLNDFISRYKQFLIKYLNFISSKANVITLNANTRNGPTGTQPVVKTWNERELYRPSRKLTKKNLAMD